MVQEGGLGWEGCSGGGLDGVQKGAWDGGRGSIAGGWEGLHEGGLGRRVWEERGLERGLATGFYANALIKGEIWESGARSRRKTLGQ